MKEQLLDLLKQVGVTLADHKLLVKHRGMPHEVPFKGDKLYVYTFKFDGQYLKIGKAGKKSKARLQHQHYSPTSSASNLALSLLQDENMKKYNITNENVGAWIRNNVERVDIEIDEDAGVFVQNFIEAALHCMFKPKYEGFESQR
ncbi:hypothetical protein [Paenibacillus protaetiae]|uniref:GIY-YIG nuclease family protein n=1 Tax=Paenibacillus protaetiae TaxID=2509456 RepID=A0A4P6ETU1_9BACL|nr:hypothetical protein [Paenibacillus protaetiae]QAY66352.1 hypothetical protein ET464_07975 [Paenibacillus protaetiae]